MSKDGKSGAHGVVSMASTLWVKLAAGRRWVESVVVTLVQWLVRLLVVACWAMIVMLIAGVLYWLGSRMFGWPLSIAVRVNTQELMGLGVFIFCAAFALKARA